MKNILLAISFSLLFSACANTLTHTPLTANQYQSLDFSATGGNERWWGDTAPPNLNERLRAEAALLKHKYANIEDLVLEHNLLALSGGGANGAFGAGILAGWSMSGQRPHFDIVTGSSTGAIIAPFAYLGVDYDETLLSIYATTTRDSIYQPKVVSGLLSGSAFSDTSPLKQQIDQYINVELIRKIAVEYRKNRQLFIVTTHFDAMRPIIWDIGYIAHAHGDDGVDLIRQVILASASIPVLFPPVVIERNIKGETFTEMHVDGGMTRSVFAYPAQINVKEIEELQGIKYLRNVYVIMNGNSRLAYEPVETSVLKIAGRTTYGLLLNQANAAIERIYFLAKRDGIQFNMIEIPDFFKANGATKFDTEYMNELLELGQEMGSKGSFWHDRLPMER